MPSRTKPQVLAALIDTLDRIEAGEVKVSGRSVESVKRGLRQRIKSMESAGVKPADYWAPRFNNRAHDAK